MDGKGKGREGRGREGKEEKEGCRHVIGAGLGSIHIKLLVSCCFFSSSAIVTFRLCLSTVLISKNSSLA